MITGKGFLEPVLPKAAPAFCVVISLGTGGATKEGGGGTFTLCIAGAAFGRTDSRKPISGAH